MSYALYTEENIILLTYSSELMSIWYIHYMSIVLKIVVITTYQWQKYEVIEKATVKYKYNGSSVAGKMIVTK